ncbi:recombinase family protein [Magnetococcus sp. PR-3]|uniref:recombinase family protein n=1 Tax=Magnetococcus sp. PR-3 TaxID=3120355 RepID=UPI002FCE0C41
MGQHLGYIRVSTVEQNTSRQLEGVEGIEKTFTDRASGGSKKRPELNALLEYARTGDTVHVHSIDRLARDLGDLLSLLEAFTGKGVTVQFHKEGIIFTGEDANPFQQLQLQIIGAVAQFERSIIKERQAEGIAKAKERGIYKGRKKSIDRDEALRLHSNGVGPTEIAKRLGVARSSVYRVLDEAKK